MGSLEKQTLFYCIHDVNDKENFYFLGDVH